jgi:hypothetical protein
VELGAAPEAAPVRLIADRRVPEERSRDALSRDRSGLQGYAAAFDLARTQGVTEVVCGGFNATRSRRAAERLIQRQRSR